MITEIFCEGKRLDINADIDSLLTFAIDDVKDFASRQTTFSKTVVIPGTANNNAIFGNIFDTGISNDYDPSKDNSGFNFNAAKSARCIIFQDFLQTFKGTLRLLEIVNDRGRIEYEIALNGELTTLNNVLGNRYLTDLDFSAYDQIYNVTNILASGFKAPGSGIYYPLIDYGTYSVNKHDWDIRTFRPALYVKEYIDKMFSSAYLGGITWNYSVYDPRFVSFYPDVYLIPANGVAYIQIGSSIYADRECTTLFFDGTYIVRYTDFKFTIVSGIVTSIDNPSNSGPGVGKIIYLGSVTPFRYKCDLFQTDRFKRLIVPHNQKQLQSLQSSNILAGSITTGHSVLHTAGGINDVFVPFDSFTGGGFTYSGGVFTYIGASPLKVNIVWSIPGSISAGMDGGSFFAYVEKNGQALATDSFTYVYVNFEFKGTLNNVSLVTNDKLAVHFIWDFISMEMDVSVAKGGTFKLSSQIPVLLPISPGQLITVNDSIPQNIRQIDFLTSIVKLFNLYVYESQFDEQLILISPFVDFFEASEADSIDWTYKLNRDAPIKIRPLSELNSRIYKFNYRDDTDYFNDMYKKRYNQGYGSYTFDSKFEFSTNENKLELIFASTPLLGYIGEEKVYPTIFKRTGTTTIVEENTDCVIRIMQTKQVFVTNSWNIMDGATVLTNVVNYYPYAGHFDDPDNPDNDINFGALNELFFELAIGDLSKNQFNLYWSGYMAEITDKDSKMLTANFYLTAKDIFNLDFSKYIIVDGTLFRLNKITDYNVSEPGDCVVELLNVIHMSYSFPPINLGGSDYFLLWNDLSPLIDSDNKEILYK
jgi:hypothetical protein